MNQQQESQDYNQFKELYQKDLINNMYPILPAFYYYLNHSDKIDLLDEREFEEYFMSGLSGYIHPITLEQTPAKLDIDEVLSILNGYYDIRALTDSEGNFIRFV